MLLSTAVRDLQNWSDTEKQMFLQTHKFYTKQFLKYYPKRSYISFVYWTQDFLTELEILQEKCQW